MNREERLLISDLSDLISKLGTNGGLIGPSVYDTAQVLRMVPDMASPEALAWLLAQQEADGGWGDPAIPRGRTASTVAAMLALQTHQYEGADAAIRSGLDFLHQTRAIWTELPDDIPLASEIVLPHLVDEAIAAGLPLNAQDYALLRALGDRRRQIIRSMAHPPGAPALHSWEAWGQHATRDVLDGAGSVGHSPAATAAWHALADDTKFADEREHARRYLHASAHATGVDIPGVVPTVWPYGRNEQIVSLYTILIAGLIDHPGLADALKPQLENLRGTIRPDGYGISDMFRCDGDLTAMAFAVLKTTGYHCDPAILRRYMLDNTCLTYPKELQRSRSATSHAAHALALIGDDATPILSALLDHRDDDGRYTNEKWHASVWYLTGHAIHACIDGGMAAEASGSLDALLAHQHADGGWGDCGSNGEETAYATIGLLGLHRAGLLTPAGEQALHRAARWLRSDYRPLSEATTARWTAKELYRPRRIARIEEVAATLACVLGGWGQAQ